MLKTLSSSLQVGTDLLCRLGGKVVKQPVRQEATHQIGPDLPRTLGKLMMTVTTIGVCGGLIGRKQMIHLGSRHEELHRRDARNNLRPHQAGVIPSKAGAVDDAEI